MPDSGLYLVFLFRGVFRLGLGCGFPLICVRLHVIVWVLDIVYIVALLSVYVDICVFTMLDPCLPFGCVTLDVF